ncbi:radical SAM protein [Methanomethylophilus alvi]|uniref:radical SAM protein n=1 Tax=Methanomethylophilus alvi TaxID=1291540 RepID=UPI0037DD665A
MDDLELSGYMSSGARHLVKDALRASLSDPRELLFLLRFRRSLKRSERRRKDLEDAGTHVPVFLISSITGSCNLFCRGCYARANGTCGRPIKAEMSVGDWSSVFRQAEGLGIPFNILAGGEPMMRMEVVLAAAGMRDTVFPVFTNGTLIGEKEVSLFKKHRNLVPVLSLEGGRERTDARRGPGTYDTVTEVMGRLRSGHVFYGLSVTVTKENQGEVLSDGFLETVAGLGCGILFLIEFVPTDRSVAHLAPDAESRKVFDARLAEIRRRKGRMRIMAFPGDERYMGGCIGAGRGFFHINPYGDAEACPASPHSDVNLMNSTLEEVLSSPLFAEIRKRGMMEGDHAGGCALAEMEAEISALLGSVGRDRM